MQINLAQEDANKPVLGPDVCCVVVRSNEKEPEPPFEGIVLNKDIKKETG